MNSLWKLISFGCVLLVAENAFADPVQTALIHERPDSEASYHSKIDVNCTDAKVTLEWGRLPGEPETFWSAAFNDHVYGPQKLALLEDVVESQQKQIAGASLYRCSRGQDGKPVVEVAIALWYDENDKYKLSHALWAFSANGLELLEAESYSRH